MAGFDRLTQTVGLLHSINTSGGGVPKLARRSAHISRSGVDGDVQRDRRHHGGPDRAVSLYSLELIEALQAEGHPISVGSIGENLTLSGIDWRLITTGTRLDIGEVQLELTTPATPCRNIAGSFQDGLMYRISQKAHPGWSRFYARVLTEGHVTQGDHVRVLT